MKTEPAEPSGVLVLHKTLDILERIKTTDGGYKLADLARKVELPKATVYRILSTLEGRGYLDRSADGSYRLAKKLFDLQRTVPLEQTLHRVSQPVMERLAASCKETVNLGIVDAGEVVVINTVESPQAVRMSSKIGNRRHLHSTAIGKVMLAGMPDKEVQRLLRLKGLAQADGGDADFEGGGAGGNSAGAAAGVGAGQPGKRNRGALRWGSDCGPEGQVIAALSISGPEFRMDLERARALVPGLKAACAEISRAVMA